MRREVSKALLVLDVGETRRDASRAELTSTHRVSADRHTFVAQLLPADTTAKGRKFSLKLEKGIGDEEA